MDEDDGSSEPAAERHRAECGESEDERPGLDGLAVMQQLGIGPGPGVGEALAFLLDLKRREGELPRDELSRRLDAWWAARPTRASSG